MNPIELKRQILMQSERLGIRKKIMDQRGEADLGLSNETVKEIGNLFEGLTQHKGWAYVEAYILRRADPVGLLMAGDNDPGRQGEARALLQLMQYIDQMIKAKNELMEKEGQQADGASKTE